jgi:hypothetical protein
MAVRKIKDARSGKTIAEGVSKGYESVRINGIKIPPSIFQFSFHLSSQHQPLVHGSR